MLSHCLSQPPIVRPGPPYCAPLLSRPGRLLGPSPLSATPVTALHICKLPVTFRRVPALQPALKPLRNLLLTCLSSLTCPPSATPVDLLFATRPVQLSLCVRVSPHHAYVTPPHPHLFTSYPPRTRPLAASFLKTALIIPERSVLSCPDVLSFAASLVPQIPCASWVLVGRLWHIT